MELDIEACAKYFTKLTQGLPPQLEAIEMNLLNVAYFAINGLAVLGKLDSLTPEYRQQMIEWLYSQQVLAPLHGGFRPSSYAFTPSHTVEESHITMTYCALCSLLLLGDDLSRVESSRILETLKLLEKPNGSFMGHLLGSEDDLRFVYCVAVICRILGSYGDLNIERTIDHIVSCQTYEGGFAHIPGGEAHGGATYCAISSLDLFGALDKIRDRRMLAYWLSQRQKDGFNGRTHKLTDTCYTYWVGSPMKILGWFDDIVDKERLIAFIFSNYCEHGQFRANKVGNPDFVHTHFSLIGLSYAGYPGLEEVEPAFGFVKKYIPERMLHPIERQPKSE